MEELFSEALIKKKSTPMNLLLKFLPFGIGILGILGGLFFHPLLLMAGILFIGLGIFLKPRQEIEYEYSYVNGTLDVDCIYGRQSRKSLASYDLCQMESMAPAASSPQNGFAGGSLKTVDYTSGEEADRDKVYAVILPHNGERIRLLFQPTESMKKDIRMRAPSKVRL